MNADGIADLLIGAVDASPEGRGRRGNQLCGCLVIVRLAETDIGPVQPEWD